jgi:trans-2,3-dihydro-3-hydroxyanthranilate isomerase
MPTLRYVTCDVFTPVPFAGNPLAVVFGAEGLPTATLQAVAREFNYSETTFVFAAEDPAHARRVRIFTPGGELPFAGHPTIGTAHVLVATGEVPVVGEAPVLVLEEGVGPVPVRLTMRDGVPVEAQLTTAQPPEERADGVPSLEALAAVLSLSPGDFTGGAHPPMAVSVGIPWLIVPLASVGAVRRATVDAAAWRAHLAGRWGSELLVFAMARDADETGLAEHVRGCDIRARAFVPGLAVPEDPATGSANGCLAAYLAARTPRDGTLRWRVAQGVEMGRPSMLSLEVERQGGVVEAVRVGGATVLMAEGTMRV